jgi:hypothetical protein
LNPSECFSYCPEKGEEGEERKEGEEGEKGKARKEVTFETQVGSFLSFSCF